MWFDKLMEVWRAGVAHAFLLVGNTSDTLNGRRFAAGLAAALARGNDRLVVTFRRGAGFRLHGQEEQVFMALAADALGARGGALQAAMRPASPSDLPTAGSAVYRIMERVLLARDEAGRHRRTAVIVDYAELLVPAAEYAALDPEAKDALEAFRRFAGHTEFTDAGNMLILLAQSAASLHPDLRSATSRIEVIDVPLPDLAARREWLSKEEALRLEEGFTLDEAAAATAGLNHVQMEDVTLQARASGGVLTRAAVRERKRQLIRQEFGELLDVVEPEYGFEAIGGLVEVKRYLTEEVVAPLREGRLEDVPAGIGFFGPPGTGKTAIMQAAAREAGINAAVLNPAKIFDKWVGSSEQNFERALACIDALAPCFVFVDEVDQVGLRREGDSGSGVSNRLFKRLLEVMSDPRRRGRVVWVVASNRPDLLDAAFKRAGRLDARIPFLPPAEHERVAILEVLARRAGAAVSQDALASMARGTEGWTGAELELLMAKARKLARRRGSQEIDAAIAQEALAVVSPARASRDVALQTSLAILECSDAELLPPQHRPQIRERHRLEEQVTALRRGPRE